MITAGLLTIREIKSLVDSYCYELNPPKNNRLSDDEISYYVNKLKEDSKKNANN